MSANTFEHDDDPVASSESGVPAGSKPALEADAPEAEPAAAAMESEEDDDGPVEIADPFEGGENARPVEELIDEEATPVGDMQWYILKVQSNREDSTSEALRRRIMLQGMEKWFGEVIVPKEQVTDFKGGKKRVVSRKLYPGYILVQMILNDETWYLVRETGWIGDFTGSAGRPSPMLPQDVAKLLHKEEE